MTTGNSEQPRVKRKYTKKEPLSKVLEQMQLLMLKQMEVSEMQTKVLQSFMDGFKVDGPPEVRVMTDAAELKLEQDRFEGDPNVSNFPSPDWVVMRSDN